MNHLTIKKINFKLIKINQHLKKTIIMWCITYNEVKIKCDTST